QMKGEKTAGAARLRFVRIGVGKATVILERHCRDPLGTSEGRGRAKADKRVLAGKPLEEGRQLGEISFTAKQLAVMREAVRADFEAAVTYPFHRCPVDRILRQRQVPGGQESVLLLEVRHALHARDSEGAFDIMRQHDAAAGTVRPKSNMPSVTEADA